MTAEELQISAVRLARIDRGFERLDPKVLHELRAQAYPTVFPGGEWIGLLDSTKRRWTLHSAPFGLSDPGRLIVPDFGMEIHALRFAPISADEVVIFVAYHDRDK
jgi:hypothetical protein